MRTRLEKSLRIAGVGLVMMFGSMAISPATAAQDVEDPVAAEEDEGFDDWGLLGLLGLAGLAGLLRRPQPVVHETERRTDTIR